ncbi:MAG: 4'-phosphopantetheinyl transferase superfamily protein [Elusimicrobia bacterium]|nr:4'-phosphopantetheinyl transferase superfamily protein [Elusimicrobiota bacterium]
MQTEIKTETIRTLRNGVRLNFLRSAEIPPPEKFLSASELEKCSGFKIEKRKSDWLGGRYAAKTLLREILELPLSLCKIEITYDLFGRPVWRGGSGPHLISITHSGPFCAAAAKTEPCVFLGIDLEKAEPRVKPWYEDYFHKEELHLQVTSNRYPATIHPVTDYRSPATIHLATRLWTEKEALLKALGLGLKADPLDIKIGKEIQFSNAALKRYEELGRPEYLLETSRLETGYYLSAVAD